MSALAARFAAWLRLLGMRVSGAAPGFPKRGKRYDVREAMLSSWGAFHAALTTKNLALLARAHRRPDDLTDSEWCDVLDLRDKLWCIIDAAERELPGLSIRSSRSRLDVPELIDAELPVPDFRRP